MALIERRDFFVDDLLTDNAVLQFPASCALSLVIQVSLLCLSIRVNSRLITADLD